MPSQLLYEHVCVLLTVAKIKLVMIGVHLLELHLLLVATGAHAKIVLVWDKLIKAILIAKLVYFLRLLLEWTVKLLVYTEDAFILMLPSLIRVERRCVVYLVVNLVINLHVVARVFVSKDTVANFLAKVGLVWLVKELVLILLLLDL